MIYVDSSNLYGVEYDYYRKILTVEFVNGSVYLYYDVPSIVYEELMKADSKGRYHYYNIRKDYSYERIY